MKILLIGNHTCGNRGDGAILRGLALELERRFPGVELEITSRYPVSSSWLLGRPCRDDIFHRWHARRAASALDRLRARAANKLLPALMAQALSWPWLIQLLPKPVRDEIARMRQCDAVVQVGGSFFIDLYGSAQLEGPFAALLSGRPLYLIGHSMGPFGGRMYRWLVGRLLRYAQVTVLRESISLGLLQKSGLPAARVQSGADTAWLVDPAPPLLPQSGWWSTRDRRRPLVAITVRELAPFDRRLGVTQDEYEAAFARLAGHLIGRGCDVVAVSTCTGIDSYHRDDRMNALRIAARVGDGAHLHVLMDECSDVELGRLLGACELLVGTRLHSAIIAMNFGTPAIAINYEHKSAGVLRQLGLPELACDVAELMSGQLVARVDAVLDDPAGWRQRVAVCVAGERQRARGSVGYVLAEKS
ncbi:MAG: colanic acid biosynthesis pyruvyl transferase WcaK [Steroidobacteraceae bacterium]